MYARHVAQWIFLFLFMAFMPEYLLADEDESSSQTLSCGTAATTAKLNEIAFNGGGGGDTSEFIEVYFTSNVSTSGWRVCFSSKGGDSKAGEKDHGHDGKSKADENGHDEANSNYQCSNIADASYAAGTFWVTTLSANSLNSTEGEVVLLDGSGKALDHLGYDNKSSCSSNVWDVPAACGGDSCLSSHNASNKDIARLTDDGGGNWQDNASDKTKGCSNSNCSGGGSGGSGAAGSFNAVDVGADAVSGVIKTKIAGQAFNLDIVALNPAGNAVLPAYSGTVSIALVDASSGAACSAMPVLQTLSSITFSGAGSGKDNGRKTVAVSYADAARNVKVRMGDSSGLVVCSSDNFAIRPASFSALAQDNDWTSAGTARTLDASAASATPVHKAGRPFTLTITALNDAGAVTPGYNATPSVVVDSCILPASACVVGSFSTGSFSGSGGIVASSTASYSEVGAIAMGVSDSGFAAVDARDGSTVAERTISSTPQTIGRFVPDHFDVVRNTPVFAPASSGFSYIGQAIRYASNPVATVTAKDAAGTTTRNYGGSLWKITAGSAVPSYSEASHVLTVLNASAPVLAGNGNGSDTLTFADTASNILGISRADPIAPFNAEIAMRFTVQDDDGVSVANVDGVAAGNPVSFGLASAGNGIAFSGGNNGMRWGRLVLSNAYGSELNALAVPLFSEYFNGKVFVTNTLDSATTLTLSSQLSLRNPDTANGAAQAGTATMSIAPAGHSKATLANASLVAGQAGLSFSAPGAGNTGYIDVSGNFAALPWLLFDWDHDGTHNDSPSARASFGIYKGNGRQIYLREVY